MIVFFALLGISCKRKIPEAHTSLEVVRVRYGMCLFLRDEIPGTTKQTDLDQAALRILFS